MVSFFLFLFFIPSKVYDNSGARKLRKHIGKLRCATRMAKIDREYDGESKK